VLVEKQTGGRLQAAMQERAQVARAAAVQACCLTGCIGTVDACAPESRALLADAAAARDELEVFAGEEVNMMARKGSE